MEGIMAVLTHEQQAVLGTVRFGRMPTHRARLATVVGVDLDRHRRMQEGFVGNHAVQLGKGPFGVGGIGLPLLPGNGLGAAAVLRYASSGPPLRALANVGQVLQSDEAMRVLIDDAFGDHMSSVLRSPVSLVR